VVKYNPATRIRSVVASLSGSGLESAGDLCFLNGYLYVACTDSKLAKIDPSNGSVQVIHYTGDGTMSSFGLMTLNDGFLYTCLIDKLYRLDPNTWVGTLFMQLPTYGSIWGLSTYSDICDAPSCRARIHIETQTAQPFCGQTGVKLKAVGTGINLASRYDWTLPDHSIHTGDTLTAFTSGTYYVNFHSLPDTCGKTDSIVLNIMQPPGVLLGNDTVVCANSSMLLVPACSSIISQYTWYNGSHNATMPVSSPGSYWVTVANTCGSATDSVWVAPAVKPEVKLPSDTSLCPGSSIVLQNFLSKQSTDRYTWNTGSSADMITAGSPDMYWLRSENPCGVATDSVIISFIDSCICKPFTAAVQLGGNQEICHLDTVLLQNSFHKQGYRYRWQDGSGNSFYKVTRPGIYWADVTTYCNTVRDTVLVTAKENCECNVYFPNAFTPNHDKQNDLFRPLCACVITGEIKIFNRWGQLVYHAANLNEGWDGRFNGMDADEGIYVYYLQYAIKNRPGKQNKKGTVMMIR
jgi:gliding motility-associated-like protein